MMDYLGFVCDIKTGLEQALGEGYMVEETSTLKNNGVIQRGFNIRRDSSNISPTIYIDGIISTYEKDPENITVGEVIENILNIYRTSEIKSDYPITKLTDFDMAKGNICHKLISMDKNQELLETVPYIPYINLALVFYIRIDSDPMLGGFASVLVNTDLMNLWGKDVDDLIELASKNTPALLKPNIQDMESILSKLLAESSTMGGEFPLKPVKGSMYVLTNASKLYGASAMLYPDLLKDFSEKINGNFYILPSSLHEVILLPDNPGIEKESLKDMVVDVNSTQLAPGDVLSDSVYYYDRSHDDVSLLCA